MDYIIPSPRWRSPRLIKSTTRKSSQWNRAYCFIKAIFSHCLVGHVCCSPYIIKCTCWYTPTINNLFCCTAPKKSNNAPTQLINEDQIPIFIVWGSVSKSQCPSRPWQYAKLLKEKKIGRKKNNMIVIILLHHICRFILHNKSLCVLRLLLYFKGTMKILHMQSNTIF